MRDLDFRPKVLISDAKLAELLSIEPWVEKATHVDYIDAGDANEDIPVSYVEITLKSGRMYKIRSICCGFTVEGAKKKHKKDIVEFFDKLGFQL